LSHFWEECDALAHENIFFNLWRFWSHPSRETSHFGPAGTNFFWTGRNVTIQLGLKHFFLFTSQICHLSRKREAGRQFGLRPTLRCSQVRTTRVLSPSGFSFLFFKKKQVLLCDGHVWRRISHTGTTVPKISYHHSWPSPMRPNELWTCSDTEPPGLAPGCRVSVWVAFFLLTLYWGFVTVCHFILLNRYWGIVMYGPGASSWARQGRHTHDPRSPTSQPYPVPP